MSFVVLCDACRSRFELPDDLYEQMIKGRVASVRCTECGVEIKVDDTGGQPVQRPPPKKKPPLPARSKPKHPAPAAPEPAERVKPPVPARAKPKLPPRAKPPKPAAPAEDADLDAPTMRPPRMDKDAPTLPSNDAPTLRPPPPEQELDQELDASAQPAATNQDVDAPTLPAPTNAAELEAPAQRPRQPPSTESGSRLGARAWLIAVPMVLALAVWGISRTPRSNTPQSIPAPMATPAGKGAETAHSPPTPEDSRGAPTMKTTAAAEPVPSEELGHTTPPVMQATPAAGSPRPIAARRPAAATPSPGAKPVAQPAPKTAPAPQPVAAAGDAEFNRSAAASALAAAASEAMECRKPGDPAGSAVVVVTFAPSGRVTSAVVSGKPFAGTATGGCIAATMRRAQVPAFSGERITVSKTVPIR